VIEALDGGGLVALIGSPGAGKTQIGVCAIRFFCQRRQQPCRYDTLGDLFATIRTAYGPTATRNEVDVLTDYTRPTLLVVDEIDKRGGTDSEGRLLHRILDKRYRELRPTLLIGNVPDAEGLKTLLDGAGEGVGPLFDRLRETGGVVPLFGISFRAGGAK
jgi:DNA replication protein DnaC